MFGVPNIGATERWPLLFWWVLSPRADLGRRICRVVAEFHDREFAVLVSFPSL